MLALAFLSLLACHAPEEEVGPTWTADVQPVIHAHCSACHSDGGGGPFPLDSYEAFVPLAEASLAAIEGGVMPPLNADLSCRDYEGVDEPDEAQVATLRAWMEAGMPEGDPSLATTYAAPTSDFVPTHTASIPQGYVSSAVESDDYRCFLLDMEIPEEAFVEGTQVLPGSPQVHHVLVYAVPGYLKAELMAAAEEDGQPGYPCFAGPVPTDDETTNVQATDGLPHLIAGWVPGAVPIQHGEDLTIQIAPDSLVVMQIHYSAFAGEPQEDHTTLELALGTTPPQSVVTSSPLAILDLFIPADDPAVEVSQTFTSWSENTLGVRMVAGHMHLLGTSVSASFVRGEERECLLDIPDWDFNWQRSMILPAAELASIAPGDGVEVRCAYDNSAGNQPVMDGEQQPPEDVIWGDGTLDEMCVVYVGTVTPYEPAASTAERELPCTAAIDCEASCGEAPTMDCLLSCESTSVSCAACVLDAGLGCGLLDCASVLQEVKPCMSQCLYDVLAFGGAIGSCLDATCPDEAAAALSCMDPVLAEDACDGGLAGCGWGW